MDRDMTRLVPGSSEDRLQRLWQAHLNRGDIGLQDDFFEAGGSSMQAIEMLMTVSDLFGAEIDYAEFFREPSIRKLAQLLGGASLPREC